MLEKNNKLNKLPGILVTIISLTVFSLAFIFLTMFTQKNNISFNTSTINNLPDYPVIIIDPGHGGQDGGAVGSSGIMEKNINLKISRFIYDFCRISGIDCVLTRTDDSMLTPEYSGSSSKKRSDLIARTEIASKFENAVFISIHQNKFESGRYKGLQVFYSKNNSLSTVLAKIIQEYNRDMLDSSNKREIKAAGSEIYVLDNIDAPAVLVECGFLSNAEEESKLNSEQYQKELAFMIFSSLMKYVYGGHS